MAFISIENITKVYTDHANAGVRVLSDIKTEIDEGEFACLMGPSGSGKSTLLTVIGAMNSPTSGRLVIDGIDVFALSEERRADFRREYIGFVFQQHHLLPYLNAMENVMLPLVTVKGDSRQKARRAIEALERVGLSGKTHRLPNQLSGGEQGRVAIARAIVNEPPLLLADEPTGTLDSRTGDEIMQVFKLLSDQGQTIFMVTHNRENAALAHRVLQIKDGVLSEDLRRTASGITQPDATPNQNQGEGEKCSRNCCL